MISKPSSTEAGTFFLAAIALSLATWPVTFTLGTHGELFFQDVFNIWIASVAALIAGAIVWRMREGEAYFTWWGAGLLLIPTIWMASVVFFTRTVGAFEYCANCRDAVRLIALRWLCFALRCRPRRDGHTPSTADHWIGGVRSCGQHGEFLRREIQQPVHDLSRFYCGGRSSA